MNARNHRVVASVAVGAVSLFAALAMTTVPAYAEDPSPEPSVSPSAEPSGSPSPVPESPPPPTSSPTADLDVVVPGTKVTLGSQGKWVRVDVANFGQATAENVTVTIDPAGLSGNVEIELPDSGQGCQVSGGKSVCEYPDLAPKENDSTVAFKITPKPGAEEGPAGTVKVSATSDTPEENLSNNSTDAKITLVGSGIDFTAWALPVGPVKPGKSDELVTGFINQGDEGSAGWVLRISAPSYSDVIGDYEECTHDRGDLSVTCVVRDAPTGPGEGWDLSGLFRISVSKYAPGPASRVGSVEVYPIEDNPYVIARRGSGTSLLEAARKTSLRAVSAQETDQWDNWVDFPVKTASNPADLDAIGAKVTGQVGDTVVVKLGAVNHGPANTVRPNEGVSVGRVTVTVPKGVEVLGVHERCDKRAEGVYHCFHTRHFKAGEKVLFDFKLKITSAKVADGKVTVDGGALDNKRSNNTAKIVVVIGDGNGGSGGGGGDLPVTGTSLGGFFGGGAVALLLGGALVMAARWRRTPAAVVGGSDAAAA